jgi:hypothetical protein
MCRRDLKVVVTREAQEALERCVSLLLFILPDHVCTNVASRAVCRLGTAEQSTENMSDSLIHVRDDG